MLSGIASLANFFASSWWRTVSNAFEKSSAMMVTYLFDSRRSATFCMMVMTAAVVDPVGLKAYWSERRCFISSIRKAGYTYVCTTSRSTILASTGTMEIIFRHFWLGYFWHWSYYCCLPLFRYCGRDQ